MGPKGWLSQLQAGTGSERASILVVATVSVLVLCLVTATWAGVRRTRRWSAPTRPPDPRSHSPGRFSAAGRRRRRLEKAVRVGRVPAALFESLAAEWQTGPPMRAADWELFDRFLALSIDSIDDGWAASPVARVRRALDDLRGDDALTYRLASHYHRLALKNRQLGHAVAAREAAVIGCELAGAAPLARADCAVLLVESQPFDEELGRSCGRLLNDHGPQTPPGQRLVDRWVTASRITARTLPSEVHRRLPWNEALLGLLGPRTPTPPRISIGIGHLVLGDLEPARVAFGEVLSTEPAQEAAAQGLVAVAFRQKRFGLAARIAHDAVAAGCPEAELGALERLGLAAEWLSSVRPQGTADVASWSAAAAGPFTLETLFRGELAYVRGRLAAISGDWPTAVQHLASASRLQPEYLPAQHAYADVLQISGRWDDAAAALKQAPGDPEFICLELRQERHDLGPDEVSPALLERAHEVHATDPRTRLISAQWAVLSRRADAVPAWPDDLVLATAEQADICTAVQVCAHLAAGVTPQARALMADPGFGRLPEPVRLTFDALACWIEGDRTAASEKAGQALGVAGDYDAALRLCLALAGDDVDQVAGWLEALSRVTPHDHRIALGQALLDAQKGRFTAAMTSLRSLLTVPAVAVDAEYWLGRLLLAPRGTNRSTSPERSHISAGLGHLRKAASAGHRSAEEYLWLHRASQVSAGTWSLDEARALMEALPRPLDELTGADVRSVACFVAVCTGRRDDMLSGIGLLVDRLTHPSPREPVTSQDITWFDAVLQRINAVPADDTADADHDRQAFSLWADRLEADFPAQAGVIRRLVDQLTLRSLVQADREGRLRPGPAGPAPDLLAAYVPLLLAAMRERLRLIDPGAAPQLFPAGAAAFLAAHASAADSTAEQIRATLSALVDRVPTSAPSTVFLELARCLSGYGDATAADEAIMCYDLALENDCPPGVAGEYSGYLCHLAARWRSAQASTLDLDLPRARSFLTRAVTVLSDATQRRGDGSDGGGRGGGTMMTPTTQQLVLTALSHLGQCLAVTRLFELMRKRPLDGELDGGRYAFLRQALSAHPDLCKALADGQPAEWQPLIAAAAHDPDFARGLALLHWEWAREFESDEPDLAMYHYEKAKLYWAYLFGLRTYWDCLRPAGVSASPPGPSPRTPPPRQPVSGPGHGAQVRGGVSDEILQHHLTGSKESFHRFLHAGEEVRDRSLNLARAHLRYLCGWAATEDQVDALTRGARSDDWDPTALTDIDGRAEELVNAWISEWLAAAKRRLEDTDVELPHGISKDFEHALDAVRPCLALVAADGPYGPALFRRVLLFILQQSNSWCLETAHTRDLDRARSIITAARGALTGMASVTVQPVATATADMHQATIGLTYALMAQLADDPELMLDYAQKAVAWRPGDSQMVDIFDNARLGAIHIRLEQAEASLESGDFVTARDTLLAIDLQEAPQVRERVDHLLAAVHFRWAMDLRNKALELGASIQKSAGAQGLDADPRLPSIRQLSRESHSHLAEAHGYLPDQPVISEELKEAALLAEHVVSFVRLNLAHARFQADDFGGSLIISAPIPETFPQYDVVVQLRAACFFRRSLQHADADRWGEAVEDMRAARTLRPDDDHLRRQEAELEVAAREAPHVKAVHNAQSRMERKDFAAALQLLDRIPSTFGQQKVVDQLRAACEFNLAIACLQEGEYERAVHYLEQAKQRSPRQKEIGELLKIARQRQQRKRAELADPLLASARRDTEAVVREINSSSQPSPESVFDWLQRLQKAVKDSRNDPEIVAVRDQLLQMLQGPK